MYPLTPKKSGAISLLGLPIHSVTVDDLHSFIASVIKSKTKALIPTLNIHYTLFALKYGWLKDFYNQAQLVYCDGEGIRWAMKFLGLKPAAKLAITRWIWQLSEFAAGEGFSLFFLGARPGEASEAAHRLKEKFPHLKIVGTHHGFFEHEGPENEKLITQLNQLRPDILIVGFGTPYQERWIQKNWQRIDCHIFLTGGAVFRFASGSVKSAPPWIVRLHLEWLFRLIQEPRRLFLRYAFEIPYFFFLVFKESLKNFRRTKEVKKKN